MKTFFKLCFALSALIASLSACELLELPCNGDKNIDGLHVSKMVFNGVVSGYDGTSVRDANTKSSFNSWSDGDLVYIVFYRGKTFIPGFAVYSSSKGWSISYYGDLEAGDSQKCEVRFFVNATVANENQVVLNEHSEIYEDLSEEEVINKAIKKKRIEEKDILEANIIKKSIDARDKKNVHYNYALDINVKDESKYQNLKIVKPLEKQIINYTNIYTIFSFRLNLLQLEEWSLQLS